MNTSALCLLFLMYLYILYIASEFKQNVEYYLVKFVFLRLVALISLGAFTSAYIQIIGLIGENGLMPLCNSLHSIKIHCAEMGNFTLDNMLMKCLLNLVHERFYSKTDQDRHLKILTLIDISLSALAVMYPHPVILLYLYFSYYSLKRVCGPFLNFQWDALLLETLFLSFLLSISSNRFSVVLAMINVKVLFFRLMLGAGLVKLFSRDESWNRSFTAMSYHFLTQPLPTKLGMYLYRTLPERLYVPMTQAAIALETALPLLSAVPRGYLGGAHVYLVFWGNALLQTAILLTGYYGKSVNYTGRHTILRIIYRCSDWHFHGP